MHTSPPPLRVFAHLATPFMIAMIAPASLASRPPLEFSPVAVSGQPAPGLPSGYTIDNFGVGLTAGVDRIAFSVSVNAPDGISIGRAVISGDLGAQSLAHLTGTPTPPIPGLDGATFAQWSALRFNAAGHIATQQYIKAPGINPVRSIWGGSPDSPELIALSGAQAPGLPEGVVLSLSVPHNRMTFGDGGDVVFNVGLAGPGVTPRNDTAIFRSAGGHTRLIAREGMTHPDLPADRVLGVFGFDKVVAPRVNAHGTVAATVFLWDTDGNFVSEAALLVDDASGLRVAARTGQPVHVPGVPDARLGQFLHNTRDALINNAGQIAFGSLITGEGITEANNEALFVLQPGGDLQVIARKGDAIPGIPGLTMHSTLELRFGGGGHAALYSTLRLGQLHRVGLLAATVDDIRPVYIGGEPAPGLPEGYLMGPIIAGSATINARGQIAFLADAYTLTGLPARGGVWAFDPIDGLFSVALAGDLIEVAPGDVRTVASADILHGTQTGNSGGQDGFAGNLRDSGLLIFRATFTDGTQAILTTTIPAPPGIATILIGALCIARRRRAGR